MSNNKTAPKTFGAVLILLTSSMISYILFTNYSGFVFWSLAMIYQKIPSMYGFLSVIFSTVIALLGTSIYYFLYYIAVKTNTEKFVPAAGTVIIGIPNVIKTAYVLFAGQATYYDIYVMPRVDGFIAGTLVLAIAFSTIIAAFMLKDDMINFWTK